MDFLKKPPKFVEVIYCKDCERHNIQYGDIDETGRIYWKTECCPMIDFRGKAQGHEFDYQYCSFARLRYELSEEREKEEETDMNHKIRLHPDGTLEITMPRGKKVGRVLVCEAGTQNGSLYYPEEKRPIRDDDECVVFCHPTDAMELMLEDKGINDALVVSRLIQQGSVVVTREEDFINWVLEKGK